MRKKVLTLCLAVVVALTFVVGATPTPASAGEPLLGRIIRAAVSPLTGVIEIIGTLPKNIGKCGINIPKAVGMSVWNGVGRPFEEVGYLFTNEEAVPIMENNALAKNGYLSSALGWGLAGFLFTEPIGITPWLARGGPIAVGVGTGIVTEAVIEDVGAMQISYKGLDYNKSLALK